MRIRFIESIVLLALAVAPCRGQGTIIPVPGSATCCAGSTSGLGHNNAVRMVNAATGIISTIAGNGTAGFSGDGGPASNPLLSNPVGLAFDSAGNLYIGDENNSRVRKISTSGIISTFAGNGNILFGGDGVPATATAVVRSQYLTLDSAGNLYLAETDQNRIRKVSPTGVISTYAGQTSGKSGFSGDGGQATSQTLPTSFTATSFASTTAINRSQPHTVTWTGTGFDTVEVSLTTAQSTATTYHGVTLSCFVPSAPGTYTAPVAALAYLLPTTTGQFQVEATQNGGGIPTPVSASSQGFVPNLVGDGKVDFGSFSSFIDYIKSIPIQ